ncbi:MAG: helix-turn-helix domain containing protein [Clostridiales bacterium]|nr:TetR/AcrR family transcriptional regulator [Clostridiales bacterium]MDD7347680.1 helix-turn-helix domain containing protein [Clostridiales bacterium]MDY4061102.1 helix-turn-helix domain-containing protein [Anaerovoracaceae bacterium]
MAKKKKRNTKGKIISAAWKLFYEHGYDDTTVDDIVEESETSKGSFYHYFSGKDALLSSLSYLFDEKYEEISEELPENLDTVGILLYLNQKLFFMIENEITVDLLSRLFSSQLVTRGNRHLLDQDRTYYKLLRKIILAGQERGDLRDDVSVNEIIKAYAIMERGLMYDWCLCNGNYSLAQYSLGIMTNFLSSYKCC